MEVIMRIIKYILTRLKMLLDRFILNTDYDTLKEQNVVDAVISSDGFVLPGTSPDRLKIIEVDVPTDDIVSLENTIIVSTLFPVGLAGDYSIYDDGEVEYSFYVTRPTATTYHFRARILNYSGQSKTFPAFTITARIHQFIPSTQDN